MTPEKLFEAHREKAEKIASSLCWHYQVSGALAYQDEAKSEALMALWRECRNFDPNKQLFQRKQQIVEGFWAVLIGYQQKDPYAPFWLFAVQKVRGRVIDFFRSQRLIKKQATNGDGEVPKTMLYRERFISTSTRASDLRSSKDFDPTTSTLLDLLPSKDRADFRDEVNDARRKIAAIISSAKLSDIELHVVETFYGELGVSKKDIAKELGYSQPRITAVLKSAMEKLKAAAT